MPIPPHYLHVYQKSKQGNTFLRRYQAFNYRHSIKAVGWFDTASCELALSGKEAELFLEQYIGNRVAVFVDNPVEPIWEGMITRITFQQGTVTFTNSMDDMTNRVAVTYQSPNLAAPQTNTSTYIDNLASQAIYGIKESILQLGVTPEAASNARRDAIRALRLAIRSWPLTSAVFNSSARAGLVKVEMRGFYQTLDWDHYSSVVTTAPNANVLVQEVVQGNINGSTFFDDTDASLMNSNVSFVARRESQVGLTRWQMCQTIQEAGDGVHRWIMGVTPTDANLGTRRFYYRQADNTVKYIVRQSDGMGVIRNIYGQKVDPWRIVPDGSVRLNDALVGWDLQGDDPRVSYLAVVQYDAERQTIAWQSEDNITFDGIFRLSSFYNPVESTAGVGKAIPRQTYV